MRSAWPVKLSGNCRPGQHVVKPIAARPIAGTAGYGSGHDCIGKYSLREDGRPMRFALVFLAMCSTQQCPKPIHPAETKLYSSFHACWLDLVPKIYYSTGSRGKWKCVQRAVSAPAKPTLSHVALPSNASGIAPLVRMESGGDAELVNRFGYAGLFQFGAPLLADLGLYTPGPTEDLSTWSKTRRAAPGKWSGTFNIPGFPTVRTLFAFLESRDAQLAAFGFHRAMMEHQIERRGLDGYVDHEIGGTTITRTGLMYMIHLGGAGGAQRALQTQGRTNPRDANGTSLLDYARVGATVQGPKLVKIGDSQEMVARPSTLQQGTGP